MLADEEDSLSFAAGAFRGGTDPAGVDALVDSFKTRVGRHLRAAGHRRGGRAGQDDRPVVAVGPHLGDPARPSTGSSRSWNRGPR